MTVKVDRATTRTSASSCLFSHLNLSCHLENLISTNLDAPIGLNMIRHEAVQVSEKKHAVAQHYHSLRMSP